MDDARVRALHARAIVIDAVCPLMRQPDHWDEWIRGGTTLAIPTVASTEDSQSALGKIALWFGWLRERAETITFVSRLSDIARAKREHKLGVASTSRTRCRSNATPASSRYSNASASG